MAQILMHGTWAERDLDDYLRKYAQGSEETTKRTCTCDFCGDKFDYLDGKIIETCRKSTLQIQGKRPDKIHICNYCYKTAYKIDLEDLDNDQI